MVIRRNCSTSPSHLMASFGLAALAPACIATGMAVLGAWPVLPFAGLELVGLILAFLAQARHTLDSEHISMEGGRLVVEVRDAGRTSRHEFNPAWTQVKESGRGGSYRLALSSPDAELEVGRHWDGERRKELAAMLRQWLGTLKTSS